MLCLHFKEKPTFQLWEATSYAALFQFQLGCNSLLDTGAYSYVLPYSSRSLSCTHTNMNTILNPDTHIGQEIRFLLYTSYNNEEKQVSPLHDVKNLILTLKLT